MSPKRRADLTIEYALLGFLYRAPQHGYEIFQQLHADHPLHQVWRLKQAHLYALLARLEAEDLVSAEDVPQAARPAKRLLHLTAAGRSAFEEWLRAPVTHGRDLRLEFLAKLYWAQQIDERAAHALIESQRSECARWLDEQPAELTSARAYAALVAEFRRGQIEAMLRWLDACAESLAVSAGVR